LKTESLMLATVLLGAAALGGCADMKDQARHEPLEQSAFFVDGRSSRPLVDGTVPRGHLRADDTFYRGIDAEGNFVARMPVEPDAAMLERGRERFEIFCAPCHAKVGDGNGMIVQRGYKQAASYHTDRLRAIEDGYIYDVITNGFAQMQGYASMIRPEDRWAIVAYVRALQLSRMNDASALEPEVRTALERSGEYDPHAADADATHEGEDHGSAH
jgi:mono/diheme cytochrome c family protein